MARQPKPKTEAMPGDHTTAADVASSALEVITVLARELARAEGGYLEPKTLAYVTSQRERFARIQRGEA